MTTDTLIVAPLMRSSAAVGRGQPSFEDSTSPADLGERVFHIRSADAHVIRRNANALLQQRYAWRGYHAVSLPRDQTTDRITLSATEEEETIGTITVALDGSQGLSADDAFADEMAVLREAGLRVCEFTKLAFDPANSSKRVLAALFHVAYIVAHHLRGYDVLVMEVNPRHVRYYQRMMGATVIGVERTNRFVNAPAVLLSIPFGHIRRQLEIAHADDGEPSTADERTIYPYTFSPREEAGIVARLMKAQTPVSSSIN